MDMFLQSIGSINHCAFVCVAETAKANGSGGKQSSSRKSSRQSTDSCAAPADEVTGNPVAEQQGK